MAVYSVEQIKERIMPVAQRYGVKRVMLFGSYARGEAAEDSDVDLHVWRGNIRGLFAHDYENIDIKKAWETMNCDIAPLRTECRKMMLELEPG
jgi:predicted nucleotidyltransferase